MAYPDSGGDRQGGKQNDAATGLHHRYPTVRTDYRVLDNTDDSGTKGDNLTSVNKPTFLLGNIDADARYGTVEVQHGGTKVLTATKTRPATGRDTGTSVHGQMATIR